MAVDVYSSIRLICMLLWCISNARLSTAELQPRLQQAVKDDGSLSFLVVGDWGRNGQFNQSRVASQMGVIGEELKIDMVVSTGDNFYDEGLSGIEDPQFIQSFSNIYTAPTLMHNPWYSVLGNHDYRGDVESQLSPILKAKDDRWICFRSFIVDAEIAEFIFVDTTPFVDEYFNNNNNHDYDWKGVFPRDNYLSNLLKDVDSALRESASTQKWRIVVGHHTIKSAGTHGVTLELHKLLLPILEANNVDLYINGHDHCLQHIISATSGIQFWTSGGGSKAWSGEMKKWKPENELKFYYDGQGFMSANMTLHNVDLKFYDVLGNVLHHWTLSKSKPPLSPAPQPTQFKTHLSSFQTNN